MPRIGKFYWKPRLMLPKLRSEEKAQIEKCTENGKTPIAEAVKVLAKFALCCLLFVACTLSPPHAPRWDANINLPIINKRYTIQELIKEENDLYTDGNGLVHFVSASQLEPFSVGDRLTIAAFSKTYATKLGLFKVPAPGAVSTQLAFRDLYPNSANLAGQTAPIPGFTFSLQPFTLPPYDNFTAVEIASGNLTLALRNNLPVPIGNPLRLEIRNGAPGTAVVAFDINETIPPGQSTQRTVSFAGKSFGNRLAFVITGSSPGSGGNPIQNINPDSKMALTFTFSELQVSRATARIGPQTVSDAGETAVGDSLSVDFADAKSGSFSLAVKNNFSAGAWMIVTLPDFYRANNSTLVDSVLMTARGNSTKDFDLSGYSFRPQTAAFGQQKIRFRWRVRTTNTPAELVTLASSDEIQATFKSTKIIFSRIKGRFNAKALALTPQKFKVDLPAGLDSLRLGEVSLRLSLRNGINFPMRADLEVEGLPNQGPPVKMLVRGDLKAGQTDGAAVESIILLDKTNSNIVPFFNALPKFLTVRGKVNFGDPTYTGLVRDIDHVEGTFKFDAALAFALPAQKVETDIDVLEIDKSTRDELKNKLNRGKVMMRFNNHLPVGATISLNIASKKTSVFTTPDLSIGPFGILAPEVDPATGRVVQAKANTVEVSLTEKQLELFQKAPLFTGVLIDFPGTQGQLVRVVADDYVDIQAVAEINFAVSEGK